MGEVCCKNEKQNQEEGPKELKSRKEEHAYATYNSRESRMENNIQMGSAKYENNHLASLSNINYPPGGSAQVNNNVSHNDSSSQGRQDERVHTSPRNNNLTNSLSINSPSGPTKINIANTFIKAASLERIKKWMEQHKDYKFEPKSWMAQPYRQKHCIICGYNYQDVIALLENEDWKAINYWSSLEVFDFYITPPEGGPRDMALYTCSKTGAKICHGCFARSDLPLASNK